MYCLFRKLNFFLFFCFSYSVLSNENFLVDFLKTNSINKIYLITQNKWIETSSLNLEFLELAEDYIFNITNQLDVCYQGTPSYQEDFEKAFYLNVKLNEKNIKNLSREIFKIKSSSCTYLIAPFFNKNNNSTEYYSLESSPLKFPCPIAKIDFLLNDYLGLGIYNIDDIPFPEASVLLDEEFSISILFNEKSCHQAVLSSILDGLTSTNIKYNINPIHSAEFFKNLMILNEASLSKALFLKKEGVIKNLIYGPNISNITKLNSSLIDVFISPSMWVLDSWRSGGLTDIAKKSVVAPNGVNLSFFQPVNSSKSKQILIYNKGHNHLIGEIKKITQKLGYEPNVITYGKYNLETYKEELSKSCGMIYLSTSESQGIALAEAWAMNVPTFILKTRKNIIFYEGVFYKTEPAPYTNKNVGEVWKNFHDLFNILKKFQFENHYQPRRWVLRNLTNKACILKLMYLINNVT